MRTASWLKCKTQIPPLTLLHTSYAGLITPYSDSIFSVLEGEKRSSFFHPIELFQSKAVTC